MRESVKEFVRIASEYLPIGEPLLEFGSLRIPRQEKIADLRPLFSGKKYMGADLEGGPGVDIQMNLHDIGLGSDSVGTVLVLETLEHVEFPRKALAEIWRILKPDGIVVLSSTMNFPIHHYPKDYWRFTPEGMRSLLRPFSFSFVSSCGESWFPHVVVGVGFKDKETARDLAKFEARIEGWRKKWRNPSRGNLKESWKQCIPPVFLRIYREIKK